MTFSRLRYFEYSELTTPYNDTCYFSVIVIRKKLINLNESFYHQAYTILNVSTDLGYNVYIFCFFSFLFSLSKSLGEHKTTTMMK